MENFEELYDLPVYENLLEELKSICEYDNVCLNYPVGYEDDCRTGVGSMKWDWSFGDNGELIKIQKVHPLHEKDFTELCEVFKNTSFEKIYNALSEKYDLGRVRVMKSQPHTCLSWHTDYGTRVHFPIKTQEGCFMVIDNEIKHLKQNQWYMTDTSKMHTAFNASNEDRYHIVAVIRGIR